MSSVEFASPSRDERAEHAFNGDTGRIEGEGVVIDRAIVFFVLSIQILSLLNAFKGRKVIVSRLEVHGSVGIK